MNIRIKELWKVPVFCIVAGILSWYSYIYLVVWLGVETLPDGSIGANPIATWTFSVLIFALTLLVGWRIFRKLSKKELFCSATILVVPLLVFVILQLITSSTSPVMVQLSLYYAEVTSWGQLISDLLFLLTKNTWVSGCASAFLPYIFILLGYSEKTTSE